MKAPTTFSWLALVLTPFLYTSVALAESPEPQMPKVGAVALAFKAEMMSGKQVNFPADYKGKLVILDFWATWCPDCMREMPGLVKAYEHFHPMGVEILGISLDKGHAEDTIHTVMAEKKMTWNQVYDGKFWNAHVARMYAIEGLPHPFLIDGDTGKVIAEGESLQGEALAHTVEAAMKAKTGAK